MKFTKTPIADTVLIEPQVFGDERGFFVETWQEERFKSAGIDATFVQDNHSRSGRWTLRGLHLQVKHAQGKLVRVGLGSVFDVVVDLRRNSPSYGASWGTELSAENHRMLWVPPGLAHGILVTSESADFLYKCTDFYSPEHERTLAWNDPALNIRWPLPSGGRSDSIGQGCARCELRRHREIRVRVLVLGGGGQVASAVVAMAPVHHQVVVKTRAEIDITADEAAIARAISESRAQWIVNGAAYTAVDLAEDNQAQAIAVNDTAVGVLASAAAAAGCRLLHLSTDFVFDGKSNRAYLPSDQTQPLSVYGLSKLGGERHVLSVGGTGIVLRTAWVYAANGRNFVLTMLRLMREKEQVSVVCDQIGTPTWATGIAGAIWGFIEAGAPGGIYHWTDLGVASWYDFAVAIQDEALASGLLSRAVPIIPISSAAYPTRARRPAFSVLDTASTRALIKGPARHWRHNLRTMLVDILPRRE